jgi:membrane protease YdiL (CAAX protease family)
MVSNDEKQSSKMSRVSIHETAVARSQRVFAVVAIVGVMATLSCHYLRPMPWTWLLLLALVPIGIVSKNNAAMHLALLAALMMTVPRLFPTYPSVFVAKGAALAAYGAVCLAVAPLREGVSWFGVGKISRQTWLGAASFGVAFALFTAWYLTRYDPPAPRSLVADVGTSVVLFVVLGAAINALAEEIFWRGTMQTALESIGASARLAVLMQALHFGLAHYRGPFFAGWAGVIGTALMGLLMGHFRQRTGTLFLPWLVHFLFDAVILVLSTHLLTR